MHLQLERCGASLAARAAVIGGGGGGGGRSGKTSGSNSSSKPLREEELVSAGAQVASALAHLHARGIAHMDVKPDNIFCALAANGCSVEMVGGGERGGSRGKKVNADGGDDEDDEDYDARDPDGLDELRDADARDSGPSVSTATVAVKLGDFGLATPMKSSSSSAAAAVALAPDEGDCRYLAPELLEPSRSSEDPSSSTIDLAAADAFALGASLYELASGAPLPAGGPLWRNLREGRLALLPAASASFQRLLRSLMAPNPKQRPTMEAVLRSGPFAAAMERIEERVVRGGGGGDAATPTTTTATTSTLMPPPPPRAPAAKPATNGNSNSNLNSRFGTLSFKPTAAAAGADATR